MSKNDWRGENIQLRRVPKQKRAIQTVDKIMKATLNLVLSEGYTALTTDRIALEAGVNISSLYQYFPNKYSIVTAIYEKAASELAEIIYRVILAEMNTPIETSMRQIVKKLLMFVDSRKIIFLHLEREVPELRQIAAQLSIDRMVYHPSVIFLKHYFPDDSDSLIQEKLFYLGHVVIALVYGYLEDRPHNVSKSKFIISLSNIMLTICMDDRH